MSPVIDIAEHNPLFKELPKERVFKVETKFEPSMTVIGMAYRQGSGRKDAGEVKSASKDRHKITIIFKEKCFIVDDKLKRHANPAADIFFQSRWAAKAFSAVYAVSYTHLTLPTTPYV